MFNAYVENPEDCFFEGQDPNEKILLLLRAHPITNIPWIVLSIIIFIIPFFAQRISLFFGFDLNVFPQTYLLIFLIINYLLTLLIAYEGFLHWYFNVALVTNEKIMDISFESLLYKGVDLAPLSKIEEADSVTAGIFGTFFNFGNVLVQTAGAQVAITMKNVPQSAKVADLILDLAKIPHQHHGGERSPVDSSSNNAD